MIPNLRSCGTEGSQLKVKEAYQMISDAISSDEGEVDLGM